MQRVSTGSNTCCSFTQLKGTWGKNRRGAEALCGKDLSLAQPLFSRAMVELGGGFCFPASHLTAPDRFRSWQASDPLGSLENQEIVLPLALRVRESGQLALE